jgi:hypothetical protein
MIGQVYMLRFMRWEVVAIFRRGGETWARLKCLDKRKRVWEVPVSFLEVVEAHKVS